MQFTSRRKKLDEKVEEPSSKTHKFYQLIGIEGGVAKLGLLHSQIMLGEILEGKLSLGLEMASTAKTALLSLESVGENDSGVARVCQRLPSGKKTLGFVARLDMQDQEVLSVLNEANLIPSEIQER